MPSSRLGVLAVLVIMLGSGGAAPPDGAWVAGTVADPLAGPLAEVEIVVTAAGGTLVARSNEQGRFRLGPLAPGAVVLRAAREGYATSALSLALATNGHADVLLPVCRAVALSVLGPLPEGARFSLRTGDGFPPGLTVKDLPREFAGRAEDVPAGLPLELWAALPGRAAQRLPLTLARDHVASLPAVAPAALSGRMVDPQGTGLSGIAVLARAVDAGVADLLAWAGAPEGTSDGEGNWTISPLPAGRYALEVRGAQWSLPRTAAVTARAGETARVGAIALRRGAALAGIIVDARSGAPVAGAVLRACPDALGCRWTARATSAADGSFRLAGLDAGAWTLELQHPEFAPRREERVAAGTTGLRIALDPGAEVSGRLVDSAGRPLSRVSLAVRDSRREAEPLARRITLDAGSFRARGLPCGTAVLEFRAPGLVAARVGPLWLATGESRDVGEVVLGPGRAVRGRVADGDGVPIAGAEVALRDADTTSAWSDGDGAFELAGVPNERARLVVRCAGYAPAFVEVPACAAREDSPPLTITLSRGARLRGAVRGERDEPVAGARVELLGLAGFAAVTANDGTFGLEHVPAGPRRVRMIADPAAPESWTEVRGVELAEGGEAEVEFALGDTLAGVVLRRGLGVPFAALAAVRAGESAGIRSAQAGPDGRFRLPGVGEGLWTVHAWAESCRARFRLARPPRSSDEVELTLPSLELSGWVLDAQTGAPIAGAELAWSQPAPPGHVTSRWSVPASAGGAVVPLDDATDGATTVSGPDGSFQLCVPDAAAITLRASADGYDEA
ncbi:MAG: carboxypeptidase regulatory-like domain-containing protein, partial [Acidobacteria bacterium]|nr:carboxypeptidase regulatory-like domain-containing protein [Acidobacteriota bacterium]